MVGGVVVKKILAAIDGSMIDPNIRKK